MIRRLLVANRGEIALRIFRTCREMGVATVAVYSDADASSPHAEAADHAIRIGPAAAAESYLNISAILEAARRSGADAIHPGYGFLSENARFAQACADAGVTFVGPPADVIARMGSKTASRAAAEQASVPVVPGVTPADQSAGALRAAVMTVGVPALLKATAGGGGKGMRVVRDASEIDDAIGAAAREAQRAFGNGALYVERLVDRPRHVEVQVFGDTQGHVIHLFERDCSLQRRHQKVIEEAPAPRLAAGVRRRIHDAALAAARAVGYVGAGTVEFLVEGEGEEASFYFLEMNTRLQVEHPVTEAVTGLDLVRMQIEVASGAPLGVRQEDVTCTGHAVECRVYAEDAVRMLPQSGRLIHYREPAGVGVRVDAGVREGQTITVHYDPMIAKLIAHGASRNEAFDRASQALAAYEILGLRHNIGMLRALLANDVVRQGRAFTSFIESHDWAPGADGDPRADAAAAMAAFVATRHAVPRGDGTGASEVVADVDPWDLLGPVAW